MRLLYIPPLEDLARNDFERRGMYRIFPCKSTVLSFIKVPHAYSKPVLPEVLNAHDCVECVKEKIRIE